MQEFTSIKQFRHVVKGVQHSHDFQGLGPDGEAIRRHDTPYPRLTFAGTVKLHGSNGAVVKHADGRYEFQSHHCVLGLASDNYQFMREMQSKPYPELFSDELKFDDYCAVYGEWCGRGVKVGGKAGVHECETMFVVFAVKIDGEYVNVPPGLCSSPALAEAKIYNISQFSTFKLTIDFNHTEVAQNKLQELTEEVEAECPVALHFGFPGRVGEGIVWRSGKHIFKVKGQKHSVTKVKKLAKVDIEVLATINEFVEYAVTESRLQQGLDELAALGKPIVEESTGDFIRWVVKDVWKEETDTLEGCGLTKKKVGRALNTKIREWWFEHVSGRRPVQKIRSRPAP